MLLFYRASAFAIALALLLGAPAGLLGEPAREGPCPFTCESAGIPLGRCREWMENGRCFVEDFARAARAIVLPGGSRVNAGLHRIQSQLGADSVLRLPLPDRPVARVEVRLRREGAGPPALIRLGFDQRGWFEGGRGREVARRDLHLLTWQIDGRQPRGRPLALGVSEGSVYVDEITVHYSDRLAQSDARARLSDYESPDEIAGCGKAAGERPAFEIYTALKGDDLFSDRVRVQGAVSGSCVTEAGYYEDDVLRQRIEIPFSERLQRKEFSVEVDPHRNGQLRAYTQDGRSTVLPVGEALAQQP